MTVKTAKTATAAAKAIIERIEDVSARASSIQEEIQGIGIDILLHAYKHGDYTLANTLVNTLPDGIRKKGLVAWFEKFGGLVVVGKAFGDWKGKDHIKTNMNDAKATKWWSMKPEQPFAGYDLKDKLAALVKAAQKKADEKTELAKQGDSEKADQISIDPALLSQLRKLLA